MSAEAVPDYLNVFAASAIEYKPCRWHGCGQEAHYAFGPGAGMCEEHGKVMIAKNRDRGRQTMQARRDSAPPALLPLAKKVVDAARELDKAALAARQAEEKRQARTVELRGRIRTLIAALAEQTR